MKKQYHFTISRTDRICLVGFCMVLLSWELVKLSFPTPEKYFEYISEPKPLPEEPRYEKKEYTSWPKKKSNPNSYTNRYKNDRYAKPEKTYAKPSAPFPIMHATYEELRGAGFDSRIATNILRFIKAGGVISGKKNLERIYHMDSIQLQQALPYIVFPDNIKPVSTEFKAGMTGSQAIIDIHTATAADLETLSGIGPTLADRIVKFREALGGFSSVDQLKDCYGITPEVFEKIKPQLSASGETRVIYINEIDLATFSHPYISRKLARILHAYRNQHGPFVNASELRQVYPPDTNWCQKLLPYIDFRIKE